MGGEREGKTLPPFSLSSGYDPVSLCLCLLSEYLKKLPMNFLKFLHGWDMAHGRID